MGSKGSTTTTSTTTPNPQALSMYSQILQRAGALGEQGLSLAPFSADQTAAFGTVRGLGSPETSPYLQQAQEYAQTGAGTITPDMIAQYYNPYQKDVIDATMANIDRADTLQNNRLVGNAISKGAWGGDRAGLAQAELARVQGMNRNDILSKLQTQGFESALRAAQGDRAAAMQGVGAELSLQGAGLQGANAQLGIGDLQQKYAQAGLNLPFTTQQWLASLATGVGSQMGGTSSKTEPPPNPLNSYLGAGFALAGLFLKNGGRVPEKATGGGVLPSSYDLGLGPMALTPGSGAPKPPEGNQQQARQTTDPAKMFDMAAAMAGKFRESRNAPMSITPGLGAASPVGEIYGSQWDEPSREFQGLYADGGSVEDEGPLTPQQRIDAAFQDTQAAIDAGLIDPVGANGRSNWDRAPEAAPAPVAAPIAEPAPQFANVPLPRPRPDSAPPRESDDEDEAQPVRGLAAPSAPPATDMSSSSAPADSGQRGLLFNLSPEVRQGMIAAGLGMMGSRSPHVGVAIGEGGMKGLEAYSAGVNSKAKLAQQRIENELKAKALAQKAEEAAKDLALRTRQHDERGEMTEYQKATVAQKGTRPPTMAMENADFLAERVIAGDRTALIGLGRGAQGAENLALIQGLVAQKAKERGLDARDLLARVAEQSGLMAQQRTFGTQTARMATASTEALGAIQLGREASDLVPRGGWVPVTKAIQAVQRGTSDPNLYKFGAANLAIINTYARAISPTGVPTVNDKVHAEHLLSTAMSKEAYNAVLQQMEKEIHIAHEAPTKARELMEGIRKSGATHTQAPAGPTVPPAVRRIVGQTYDLPNGRRGEWTGSGWVNVR